MAQLEQLEDLTIEQKIAKLDKKGASALEALLTTKTLTEAAAQLDISRNTLYGYIDTYGLQELIENVKHKAILTLTQSSVDAAENLVKKIASNKEDISLQASTEILDRAGIVKPQKLSGVQVNFNQISKELRNEFSTPAAI